MDIEVAAARWSLDHLKCHQLPQIAYEWLQAGLDTPALRVLAGEHDPIMSEVGPLFVRVLEELDVAIPAPPQAARQLARRVAQEITRSSKSPYEGAREIWMLQIDQQSAGLPLIFCGLASEYEDFSDDFHQKHYGEEHCSRVLRDIDQAIIKQANKLLALE
jgi:hypothetical protein